MVRRLGRVNSSPSSSSVKLMPRPPTAPPIAAKKMPAATSQAMTLRK
jgi:hypothetical protein